MAIVKKKKIRFIKFYMFRFLTVKHLSICCKKSNKHVEKLIEKLKKGMDNDE